MTVCLESSRLPQKYNLGPNVSRRIVHFRGHRGQAGPCITALSGLTVRMICINHANANYCDLASQSNTHIPAAPGVPAWDTWRKPNMHFGRRTVLQTAIAAVVLAGGMPAQAQEVLNIYSARHSQT